MRLDLRQRAVLGAFRSLDPNGEFQYNAWYPPLREAVQKAISEVRVENPEISVGGWERELVSLTNRGALIAEGRAQMRQWGITKDGLAALDS